MLQIYNNPFEHGFENLFFREFAENIEKLFIEQDGLLVGNPICSYDETLQIDALLITTHNVCLIDFKNVSGTIIIQDDENFYKKQWKNDEGLEIKGGSSINPFLQLKYQKMKFINVIQKNIKLLHPNDTFNVFHTLRIVCFQYPIILKGNIPKKETLNFYIIDKNNYVEKIYDIISSKDEEINISSNSYKFFLSIFNAKEYKIKILDEPETQIDNFSINNTLDYSTLTLKQVSALNEINKFLSSDEQIFILKGFSGSGKSYLINFIKNNAYENNFQHVEICVPYSKFNQKSGKSFSFEYKSLYSLIYNFNDKKGETKQKSENEENNKSDDNNKLIDEKNYLKIIPLNTFKFEESTLFIVDDSHLIINSYYINFDTIFGSGYILDDFLKYTDVSKLKNKIIFIGDPYSICDSSPMDESYMNSIKEKFKLKTKSFSINDPTYCNPINKEALACVKAIDENLFNNLNFNDNIKIINSKDLYFLMDSSINNNLNTSVLFYTNRESYEFNKKIKRELLKNGDQIAPGDLVIFYKLIRANGFYLLTSKSINNGQFARVINVKDVPDEIDKSIHLKGRENPINLRFKEIELQILNTKDIINLYCFINFLENDNIDISNDELVAINVLIEKFEKIKKNNKEKNDDNLNLIIYKLKNLAYLRYGWALTIHKARKHKFDNIILDTTIDNKTTKSYFQLIYNGINCAKKTAYLIEFSPITPFFETNIENHSNEKIEEYIFVSNKDSSLDSHQQFKDFIESKISSYFIDIVEIKHYNYQEQYTFKNSDNEVTISFYYNNNQEFKEPKFLNGNEQLFQTICSILSDEISRPNQSFDFIKPDWLKKIYINFQNIINKFEITITNIIQKNYFDLLYLNKNNDKIVLKFFHNDNGFITHIYLIKTNSYDFFNSFNLIIEHIKNGKIKW